MKTDTAVNGKDFRLLEGDRYAFAVLSRILKGPCELIRTDHQRIILCQSEPQYPVWLWTPDDITGEEKERAWRLAALRPLSGGFRYNLKYETAEFFIEKARAEGVRAGITMRLYSYDCPSPIAPGTTADGRLHACGESDTEEAAGLMPLFYMEIGEQPPPRERLLEKARAAIAERAFFFWKNAEGKTVSCCSYKRDGDLASLSSVFTLPGYRRRHYAQHLVYQVTRSVREAGFIPMLYTDADYAASNACYEKIGYRLRRRLCTVAALPR